MDCRNTRGFSLIELLTVMLVISILAAIAIPNFNAIRERAFVSTMKGDLHGLRYAQEVYNVEPDGVYATTIAELGDLWNPSEDVTVTLTGDGETWSAEAFHPGTPVVCRYTPAGNAIVCDEPEVEGKK